MVCVANFRPQKDHLGLIEAMSRLPAGQLLLVGAGDDSSTRPAVERAIRARGLEARAHILGRRPDVPSVLAAADIGVLASRSEGLPLALLEYGQAGLATVATDVGQCREVLADGDAGLLVPPGDPHALAEALGRLIDDPAARRQLGASFAARLAEHYSPDAAIDRLEAIYRSVLGATA